MMRAMAIEGFGDDLGEMRLPVREPGADEVLIKVAAAAVNPADLGMVAGRYEWTEPVRFPLVPGYDVAGTVAAGALPEGTRVVATTGHKWSQVGGYAEYVTLPARWVAEVPDALDLEEAAALPLAAMTAWQALEALDLSAGQSLLVNGPRGAIGAFAVQLAAGRGLEVVADQAADAVLDVIGGEAAQRAFALVREGGRYATVVPEFWVPGGVFSRTRGIDPIVVRFDPEAAPLAELARLAGTGGLRPRIADRLPLAKAGEAHARLAARGVPGKLILIP